MLFRSSERGFRLLDDDFLTKCFEGDAASIELVLRKVGFKGAGRSYPGICGESAEPFGEAGYPGYRQYRGETECGSTALCSDLGGQMFMMMRDRHSASILLL